LREFDTVDSGQPVSTDFVSIAASGLTVDVVRNVTATPTLPACGSLRGEPCRTYQAEGNQAEGNQA
jgi:hypothetical protein